MAERSTISQVVQIGVEAVPGTAVAADKLLQSLTIGPAIEIETDEVMPTGYKYPSDVVLNREWATADLGGKPTYDEIIYVLAAILGKPTSVVQGANGAYKHTFSPSTTAEDDIATFTVEQGSAVRAHKFAYGLVPELGFKWSRQGVDLEGSMLGQRLTDAIVLTAAPTALPDVPILPSQIDVFMDDTDAALGATKLLRVFSGNWKLSDRFGPLWTVNSALDSFAAHVETKPKGDLSLLMEADAAGMALLAATRAGQRKFVRIQATGAQIGAGPETYSFKLDLAVKVNKGNKFDDSDGAFAYEWPFTIVHDATWGKAMAAEIINTTTAL